MVSSLMSFGAKTLTSLKNGFVNLIAPIKLLTDQYTLMLIANTGYTKVTASAAIANLGLLKSIKVVTAALWQQFTAWVAAGGWLIVIPAAIWLTVKAFDAFTVSAKEAKEALASKQQELEETKQKTQELTTSLEEVNKKIDELTSKGTLSLIEDSELTKLQVAREELELQLKVQKELEKIKSKEASDAAIKSINAVNFSGMSKAYMIQGKKGAFDIAERKIESIKSDRNMSDEKKAKEVDRLREYQEKLKKETLELINVLLEESKALDLKDEKSKKLFDTINDLSKSTLNWTSGLNTSLDEVQKTNIEITKFEQAQKDLNDQFVDGKISLDEYIIKQKELTAVTQKYANEAYNLGTAETYLKGVQKDVTDGKSLNKDEVEKLLKLYPQLKNAIIETADGWTVEKTALDLVTGGVSGLKFAYTNAQDTMTAIMKTKSAERLGITLQELDAIQSVADAYNVYAASGGFEGMTDSEIRARKASANQYGAKAGILGQLTELGKVKQKIQGIIDSIGKPNYSALAPDTKSSSSPYRAEANQNQALLEKDRYFLLQNQILQNENAISRVKSEQDDLNSDEIANAERLIQLYEDEAKLLKQKQNILKSLNDERRNERDELASSLSKYGITTTGEGDSMSLSNYSDIEASLRGDVDALRSSKDKVARATAEEKFKEFTTLTKRFFEIQLTDIPKTSQEWFKLAKEINKTSDAIIKTNDAVSADRINDLEHEIYLIEQTGDESEASTNKIINSYRKIQEEAHRRAEELRAEGFDDMSSQVQAQQKIWWSANKSIEDIQKSLLEKQKDALKQLQSDLQRYTSNITDNLKKRAEAYDYLIQKEQALVNAQQKQYETQAKIRDIQKDIKAQLASSKIMSEWLDEDTRKLLFNEDDYNALSDAVTKLDKETSQLHSNYANDISRLNKDNMYLEEAITKEYERRLAMKEKEYEIAKAQLNLNKKQQELDNILAEKNVKMLINGEWQWVANTADVAKATEELISLEEELADIKLKSEQQQILDNKQANVDRLSQEQAALENRVRMINENADKMNKAFEDYLNPIKSINEMTKSLAEMGIPQLESAVSKFINSLSGITGIKSSSSSSLNNKISVKTQDIGGTKVSMIYDANGKLTDVRKYARGTKNAIGGKAIVDEEGLGSELIISGGRLTQLNAGDNVFSKSDSKNLWEWAKLNPMNTGFANILKNGLSMPNIANKPQTVDQSQNFNGGIVVNNPANFDDFMRQLNQRMRKPAYR